MKRAGLFDAEWYRRQYTDVEQTGKDPCMHYLRYGAAEGRNPGPHFNTRWYLSRYPDVVASGMNPLVHYLRIGRREGRLALPPQSAHG